MKASNDKQKMIVIGALGLVLVGIGGFQLMGGGGAAPAPKPAAKAAEDPNAKPGVEVEKEASKDEMFVEQLPQRDPFKTQLNTAAFGFAGGPAEPETSTTTGADTPPPPPPAPTAGVAVKPNGLEGELEPMDPNSGAMLPPVGPGNGGNSEQLPGPDGASVASAPSYRLSGVVTGRKNMAIIVDGNGKQKLVKAGDTLDGRKVVAIKNSEVVLEEAGSGTKDRTRLSLNEDGQD